MTGLPLNGAAEVAQAWAPTPPADGILAAGARFERRAPINLSEADRSLFAHEAQYTCPATTVAMHDDVVISARGDIFRGTHVLPESFPSQEHYQGRKIGRYLRRAVSTQLLPKTRFDGALLWITDQWSKNYFHWFCDCLPRLEASTRTLGRAALLLPAGFQEIPFVQGSLQAYDLERVVSPSAHRPTARVQRLVLPSKTAGTGNYNEPLIRAVADRLRRPSRDTTGGGRRVFISRAKAASRRILNETDVAPHLVAHGVESHIFEDHSFEWQQNLMAETRLLVSSHGAGLTNMLFMPPGGAVLEIRQADDAHNNCYFALASALGHRYFYLLAAPARAGQDPATGDVIVNAEAIENALRRALSDG